MKRKRNEIKYEPNKKKIKNDNSDFLAEIQIKNIENKNKNENEYQKVQPLYKIPICDKNDLENFFIFKHNSQNRLNLYQIYVKNNSNDDVLVKIKVDGKYILNQYNEIFHIISGKNEIFVKEQYFSELNDDGDNDNEGKRKKSLLQFTSAPVIEENWEDLTNDQINVKELGVIKVKIYEASIHERGKRTVRETILSKPESENEICDLPVKFTKKKGIGTTFIQNGEDKIDLNEEMLFTTYLRGNLIEKFVFHVCKDIVNLSYYHKKFNLDIPECRNFVRPVIDLTQIEGEKEFESWNVHQVSVFIDGLNLSRKYGHIFEREQIDGIDLGGEAICHDSLRDVLKIQDPIDRMKIINEIRKLKDT